MRMMMIRMINQPAAVGKHGAGLMEWRFQVAISAPPSTLATSMHLITSTSKHFGVPYGTSKYFQVAILALLSLIASFKL